MPAINHIRGWWTEDFKGHSAKLNDAFEVRFADMHFSKQKLTEVIPNEKIVWLVTDSYLSFLDDKNEWTDTQISFEISKKATRHNCISRILVWFPKVNVIKAASRGGTIFCIVYSS
ncbi:MAG: hypothetical protein JWR12_3052 [Mucilaginibacter sp.]|nr:hypothetical protein [Mucilaginibacter sp.]